MENLLKRPGNLFKIAVIGSFAFIHSGEAQAAGSDSNASECYSKQIPYVKADDISVAQMLNDATHVTLREFVAKIVATKQQIAPLKGRAKFDVREWRIVPDTITRVKGSSATKIKYVDKEGSSWIVPAQIKGGVITKPKCYRSFVDEAKLFLNKTPENGYLTITATASDRNGNLINSRFSYFDYGKIAERLAITYCTPLLHRRFIKYYKRNKDAYIQAWVNTELYPENIVIKKNGMMSITYKANSKVLCGIHGLKGEPGDIAETERKISTPLTTLHIPLSLQKAKKGK